MNQLRQNDLKERMRAAGITQKDAALGCGVRPNTLTLALNGYSQLSKAHERRIKRMCAAAMKLRKAVEK